MSDYRADPRWQAAYADYMREGDEPPSLRMLRRIDAARRLRDIEQLHT